MIRRGSWVLRGDVTVRESWGFNRGVVGRGRWEVKIYTTWKGRMDENEHMCFVHMGREFVLELVESLRLGHWRGRLGLRDALK